MQYKYKNIYRRRLIRNCDRYSLETVCVFFAEFEHAMSVFAYN